MSSIQRKLPCVAELITEGEGVTGQLLGDGIPCAGRSCVSKI